MLSFNKSYNYPNVNTNKKPIAEIFKNDKPFGYIYFTNDENEDEGTESDEYESSEDSESDNPFKCEYCKRVFSCKAARITHQVRNSCKAKILHDFMKYSKGDKSESGMLIGLNDVKLSGSMKFRPLADVWNRENIVIIGPQNSGKSYWTSLYAQSYQSLFENDVIIISRIEDDASFKEIKNPVRVSITEELLSDPIDIKGEMSPSLTIFDDIDDSRYTPELSKYVWGLNTETLVNGRDQSGNGEHIYTITTMHITEGTKTRKILNEASTIVLFLPIGYQESRILKMYCSLSPQQINKLKKLKSRWVALNCKYRPQFIMTEKELFLLAEF